MGYIVRIQLSMIAKNMTQDARISSRIDPDLKKKSEAILAEIGIKPSQAITMFYKQIVRQRGLPLDLHIPNDETIKALDEDVSKSKRYTDLDEMFADLETNDTP